MTQFRNFDAPNAPQETRIVFEMVARADDSAPPPWESDEGFWPSSDPDAPGYVPPDRFAQEQLNARQRRAAFLAGDWRMIGVQARAVVSVPIGGGSFASYTLESPGLWGVESDSAPEYLAEVFEEEKHALLAAMVDAGQAAAGLLDSEEEAEPILCERCGEPGVEEYAGESLCMDCRMEAQDGTLYEEG